MKQLVKNRYKAKSRPSGHQISTKLNKSRGSIPANLLQITHTESNRRYLRLSQEHNIKPHPARFPDELPEYFIRMLTDEGDLVVDPFAGSCVTGEVCERLHRLWICVDLVEEYLKGGIARFRKLYHNEKEDKYYKIPRPGILWKKFEYEELASDGGKKRPQKTKKENKQVVLPRGFYAKLLSRS